MQLPTSASDLLHIDPVTVLVVVVGVIATWVGLKKDSKWHSEWIKEHSKECEDQRKENNRVINALQVNVAKLTVIAESSAQRITRIEDQEDLKLTHH